MNFLKGSAYCGWVDPSDWIAIARCVLFPFGMWYYDLSSGCFKWWLIEPSGEGLRWGRRDHQRSKRSCYLMCVWRCKLKRIASESISGVVKEIAKVQKEGDEALFSSGLKVAADLEGSISGTDSMAWFECMEKMTDSRKDLFLSMDAAQLQTLMDRMKRLKESFGGVSQVQQTRRRKCG